MSTPEEIVNSIVETSEIISLIKAIDTGIEFEVRFGLNDGSNRFIANIGHDIFSKLKKHFNVSGNAELSMIMFNTNSNSGLRVIKTLDEQLNGVGTEYMKKILIKNYTMFEHSMRFSLAHEESLGNNYEETAMEKTKNKFRFRNRMTKMLTKNFRLDFTITRTIETLDKNDLIAFKNKIIHDMKTGENKNDYVFEVELEYIGARMKIDEIKKELREALLMVYAVLFASKDIIDRQVRINLMNTIKSTLRLPHIDSINAADLTIKSIGNQVVTLEIKDINTLFSGDYVVTEKTDGERMLLWCNGNSCKLINSANELINVAIAINNNKQLFVLDGEYVVTENNVYFMIFDILIAKGMCITQLQFSKRQKLIEDFLHGINLAKTEKLQLLSKTFLEITESSFFQRNKMVFDAKRDYEIDGLIYTPVKGDYFERIYKWKMNHTIDFLVRKIDTLAKNAWHVILFVKCTRSDMQLRKWDMPEYYSDFFPSHMPMTDLHFPFPFIPEKEYTAKWCETTISAKVIEELGIEDDTIVEFQWNEQKQKWCVYDTRPDRTAIYKMENNQTFYGNAYNTAMSIYRAIVYPVTTGMMIGTEPIPKSYWKVGDKESIKEMLKFHSHIKIGLYEKYAKNANATLELGGGHANDFKKWIKSGIKNTIVVEPDKDAILEGTERIANVETPEITFINSPAGVHLSELLKNEGVKFDKFDAIFAHFSIHYFATSKEEIDLLVANACELLNPGGLFIFTTFSGEKVFDALKHKNPFELHAADKKKLLFSIKGLYPDSDKKLKHYGQMIEVFVESIGVAHKESLINLKYLIDKFTAKNFKLLESVSFESILDNYPEREKMSASEQKYSSFNQYVVLRGGGHAAPQNPPAS